MDGLIESDIYTGTLGIADRSGRQHPDRSGEYRTFIAQNISEHILHHQDVKPLRVQDELHRAVVHEDMLQGDIGEFFGDVRHDAPPELGDFQDVRFIDTRKLLAAFASQGKSHARDSLNLAARVSHCVDPPLFGSRSRYPARLSVVETARQLADNDHVRSFHQVVF